MNYLTKAKIFFTSETIPLSIGARDCPLTNVIIPEARRRDTLQHQVLHLLSSTYKKQCFQDISFGGLRDQRLVTVFSI